MRTMQTQNTAVASGAPVSLGRHAPNLPDADRAQIEGAIAEAERACGAEFVVVIAARSGRYDRAEDVFGLLCGLIAVAIAWVLFQEVIPDQREWATGWTHALGLPLVLGIFAAWCVLGSLLATRLPPLARPFIGARQMDEEVRSRAFEAYHIFRIDRGAESPGVMMYVSLLERRVFIAAADGLATRLPPEAFDGVRDALVRDIREGNPPGVALGSAVRACAAVVAPVAPPRVGRENGLPNTVRLMA